MTIRTKHPTGTSRRRFLAIAGLAGASSITTSTVSATPLPQWSWQGILFGSDVSISLHGMRNDQDAKRLTDLCFKEMQRLEKMFSLFLPESVISRLNRDGQHENCPAEFVSLVTEALRMHQRTGGAFDMKVQPLWKAMNEHDFKAGPLTDQATTSALSSVNEGEVRINKSTVSLSQKGMAITLNGIAQGFITDRVTDLLKKHGVEQSLVNMGEYRAIGRHPENRPWNLGIRAPGVLIETDLLDSVPLADQALAVSGGYGYVFDANQHHHHLVHPKTGKSMPAERTVAVTAPTATIADALSTACAVIGDDAAHAICRDLNCKLRIYNEKPAPTPPPDVTLEFPTAAENRGLL